MSHLLSTMLVRTMPLLLDAIRYIRLRVPRALVAQHAQLATYRQRRLNPEKKRPPSMFRMS